MKMDGRRIITVMLTFLLSASIFSIFWVQIPQVSAQDGASLTGVISDQGVDTDGDGTFDYLEVGVEVNVTASGMFRVRVSGLYDSTYNYISIRDENFTYLDVGIQIVYLSLYGPTIYTSGLNPVYVSDIYLYDENYNRLDSLYDVPLSREYFYTEFDAPFTDAEVKFIVYPDGQVAIQGALNQTNMVPEYTGPTIYGGVNFTESDGLTMASAGFTFILPPEIASEFPFNSTTADLFGEYVGGLLTVEINATVTLPQMIASQFPFNATDFTLDGEYLPNRMSGTVTVHLLSGFPLGDVDIDFNGNLTDISFNGSANAIYGIYNGLELNETSLPQLLDQINSTIPGRGDESLYNMTDGMFEVTRIDYTVTPYAGSAIVDFKVYIHADIVQALTTIITPPGEDPDPICSLLNSTFYSVESASIQLAYAHAQKEASMRLAFVVDADGLWEDIVSLLPEIVPPENRTLVELLLNTTFCSVESGEFSLSYSEGQADLKATVAIEGDLNAELNYLKNTLLTYAVPQPLPWQEQFINDTQIDVSNLEISLDISDVAYLINLEGLAVLPPIDVINATSFKLERFFNLTADTPFPGGGERLEIAVEGSNNATHEVKLFRPETVPEPNVTDADNKLMVWYNQSLSDLKDLIFIVQLDTTNPIADAGPDQTVKVGTTVNFDASNSTDNFVIASYEWDFGDGTTGTGMTTNHTYTEPGTYTVTLTVKDAAGNSATDTLIVTVEAAPAFPWWIVVVIVVAIIAAAVALILWKRRAQKGGKTLQSASFRLIIF